MYVFFGSSSVFNISSHLPGYLGRFHLISSYRQQTLRILDMSQDLMVMIASHESFLV